MRMKKAPSVSRVVLLLIVVVLLSSFITLAVIELGTSRPYATQEIEYTYAVRDRVGIVLDTDALHFGTGPRGATLQRGINLTIPYDAQVRIDADTDVLQVSDNDFYLEKDTVYPLEFYLTIPEDASNGNYSGVLSFQFFR